MKKQILFLFIVIASGMLISSCEQKENPIVGKWKTVYISNDIKTSDSTATERMRSLMGTEEVDEKNPLFVEFTDDKKYISTRSPYIEPIFSGSYSISENKITISYKNGYKYPAAKFTITGDTLIIYNSEIEMLEMFNDSIRDTLGIGKNVKIEKLASTITLIREK